MDRPIIYTQENVRGYDTSKGWQDSLKATGQQAGDILGQTITVAAGLAATQNSPAGLSILVGPGSIYQQSALDPTAAGDLPVDGTTHFLQGVSWSTQTVTLSTSALTSGQSQWALVQATFGFVDVIRTGDPSGGVLPFYNSANPSVPLQGQGGSGATLNTERTATVAFKIVYGTPATTGSEVPPSADTGYVGLYLIDLAYGQTAITSGEILLAGPSAGTGVPSNYPQAPFLAGLLSQHHLGIPGQAPKINLATEVQGVLPNGNFQSSGSFTGTLTGGTTSPTVTVTWYQIGNIVFLRIPEVTVTSNSGSMGMTGMPSAIFPSVDSSAGFTAYAEDNSAGVSLGMEVGTNGVITFARYDNAPFSSTGTKGLLNTTTLSYAL